MPASDNLVIVLDPGHGGKNEGLKHKGLIEKEMNLVTANAMRDELLQYDNVEVYITNPEMADMSLKERAEYAQSVEADILISLHFNMSEEHAMYGSEVWVPSAGIGSAKMRGLGDVFMEQFDEMDFTLRGVKTRLNDNGLDYYGILRESTKLGIQSILVEHGYADHERDFEKVNDKEDWQTLGRSDATAVAKYFGLKSSTLGRDYSSYISNGYFAPETPIGLDATEPENALLVYLDNSEEGDIYHISAVDQESEVVYYDYSLDGGNTWSELFSFANNQNYATVTIPGIEHDSEVVARVYNGHFLHAQTQSVYYKAGEVETKESEAVTGDKETAQAIVIQDEKLTKETADASPVKLYVGVFAILMALLLFLTSFVTRNERMKRRRIEKEGRSVGILSVGRMRQIENVSVLAGMAALLLGITVLGMAAAGKIDADRQAKETFEESTALADMKVQEQEEEEEIVIPALFDEERSEGYELLADGTVKPGEELLLKISQNEEWAVPKETVVVYDIAEGYLRTPLLESVAKNPYDLNAFSGENLSKTYTGAGKVMKGIDVSKFQGNIDWAKVKEAGVEFVILRLGIRGYGTGEMKLDDLFWDNYYGATEAGIKVGVYFFSAAIDEAEAVQEAEYVLSTLQGLTIEMPVVFDTEPILYDDARTDHLTPNQLTAITKAFCNRILEGGYHPMIYANSKRFTTVLHLEELEAYDKWLADYRETPDYPYAFRMWQFTEKGSVPGIEGNVDVDLYFYEE